MKKIGKYTDWWEEIFDKGYFIILCVSLAYFQNIMMKYIQNSEISQYLIPL